MCARQRTHFSCFAKKSKQKKATLLSATPALRYGATCGARLERGACKLAALKHARPLIRPKLRSSAPTEGNGAIHGPSLRSA